MTQEVACPRCGTRREWRDNPFRPFCSERCKLIDLGSWLSSDNAIPGEAVEEGSDPTFKSMFSDKH